MHPYHHWLPDEEARSPGIDTSQTGVLKMTAPPPESNSPSNRSKPQSCSKPMRSLEQEAHLFLTYQPSESHPVWTSATPQGGLINDRVGVLYRGIRAEEERQIQEALLEKERKERENRY